MLKGIYHYWKDGLFFSRGLQPMEDVCLVLNGHEKDTTQKKLGSKKQFETNPYVSSWNDPLAYWWIIEHL